MSYFILIISLLGLSFLSGCSSTPESLELQSVLDYKAQRIEQRKVKAEAAAIAPSPSPSPAHIPASPEHPGLALNHTPPELARLSLPKDFIRLTPLELQSPVLQERLKEIFKDATTGWQKKESNVVVLTSTNRLDPEKLVFMTKKNFLAEIEGIGKQYDSYYRQKFGSPTLSEVKDDKNLVFLKVTAKYPKEGIWQTDLRYIFFYRPDYRLNLLVTGKDADFGNSWKELETQLKLFTEELRALAQPIAFQKEPEEVY